jgi:hypothetical protein
MTDLLELAEEEIRGESIKVPIIPDIHKKIYAAASQPEALEMSEVHSCHTTHCRAGWVIVLAGDEGMELERRFGWEVAAMLIYKVNGYLIEFCDDFYCSNEHALADMKRLAEQE